MSMDMTLEEVIRREREVYFAARKAGAQAYEDSRVSGEVAACPWDVDRPTGDHLDGPRMSGWYDGFQAAQEQHEGPEVEILGDPIVVTEFAQHPDGSITYSIPDPNFRP